MEVLTGDGLRVARAVAGAPADVRDVLAVHYVLRGPVRQKAQWVGARDRRQYYGQLARAHTWIEARWEL